MINLDLLPARVKELGLSDTAHALAFLEDDDCNPALLVGEQLRLYTRDVRNALNEVSGLAQRLDDLKNELEELHRACITRGKELNENSLVQAVS